MTKMKLTADESVEVATIEAAIVKEEQSERSALNAAVAAAFSKAEPVDAPVDTDAEVWLAAAGLVLAVLERGDTVSPGEVAGLVRGAVPLVSRLK